MINKKILTLSLITTLILNLFGCGKKDNLETRLNNTSPIIRTVNRIDYKLDGDGLIQNTEDEDNTATFGIIADPHGFYKNVEVFSAYFKHQGLDGIIMLGDYAQHFRTKQNTKLSDYDEIVMCLEAAAKTGLPLYIIPGNHEIKKDYERAVIEISRKYNNIFDLSKIRTVDGDDFDFVSNPYGNDDGFSYFSDSFLLGNKEIMNEVIEYTKRLKNDNDPEILLTHQPPKCKGKYGIDVILDGRNVGNDYLDRAMTISGILFSLSGHIHEAGRGVNIKGDLVKSDTFSDSLRFNPGSVSNDEYDSQSHAGIIMVKDNQVKYQIISSE